jgi:dienelactone hydrolase
LREALRDEKQRGADAVRTCQALEQQVTTQRGDRRTTTPRCFGAGVTWAVGVCPRILDGAPFFLCAAGCRAANGGHRVWAV